MKKLYLLLLVITSCCFIYSQSNNYETKAAEVRAKVWSWNPPAFTNYEIPEELKKESAVIIAYDRQIEATGRKSNFAKQQFLGSNAGKLFYNDIDRKIIKINDQTALDKFSEYSFKEKYRHNEYNATNTSTTIIGARIIKPNGTIKEVDISTHAVVVTEGKNDKEAYKKLAIPELQIDDILDVFICEIYELETFNLKEQAIVFYSTDYPALNHTCSFKFGKNLTIEYRSINGAPEFIRSTDERGNIVLTTESSDIMRINDYNNIRWLSPLRDLPMIRFSVLQNGAKIFFKPSSARPLGVFENIPYETIIEDAKDFLAFYQSKSFTSKYKKVIKIVNEYKKKNPKISKGDLANVIYTALNFEWPESTCVYYNSRTFMLMLDRLFKNNKIDSKVCFVINKYNARKDEVLSHNDLMYMIAANNSTQYFSIPYRYRVPGEIPQGLQGELASTYMYKKISYKKNGSLKVKGEWGEKMILPESTAEENASKMKINVSFDPDDMQKINIDRHSSWSGSVKGNIQSMLVLYEDWDKEMRNYLGIRKSYVDELDESRRTRNLIDQVEGTFEKRREEHTEAKKEEIEMFHAVKPEEIKDFSFISLGVTTENPVLEYKINYTLFGFVRNAGNNIILDAGKLIGKQWDPSENERNRNTDAYPAARRVYENQIIIQIPENYTVDDIEHLNMNYSNEYASFEASAALANNTIIIKAKKSYLQTYIPKENWNELIRVLDKANEFYLKSIVLKKKTEDVQNI